MARQTIIPFRSTAFKAICLGAVVQPAKAEVLRLPRSHLCAHHRDPTNAEESADDDDDFPSFDLGLAEKSKDFDNVDPSGDGQWGTLFTKTGSDGPRIVLELPVIPGGTSTSTSTAV